MASARNQPKRRQTGQIKVQSQITAEPVPPPAGLDPAIKKIFVELAAKMAGVWDIANQHQIVELARCQHASDKAWHDWQQAGGNFTETVLKSAGGHNTIEDIQEDVHYRMWQKATKTYSTIAKSLGLHITIKHDGGSQISEIAPSYTGESKIT